MNKIEYQELIAFHPGYYVKDCIDEQGITQEELAKDKVVLALNDRRKYADRLFLEGGSIESKRQV